MAMSKLNAERVTQGLPVLREKFEARPAPVLKLFIGRRLEVIGGREGNNERNGATRVAKSAGLGLREEI